MLNSGYAQMANKWRQDTTLSKSEWQIALRYTSDYYYMGRADSAKAPYLSPSVIYFHKSGIFARSSLSYLTTSGQSRIDLYTLGIGYDYLQNNFNIGLAVNQYFFDNLSYAVQAEMSTLLSGYVGYDFSIMMLYLDLGLGFSDGTDAFVGAEISRVFYLINNKLRIAPALYANAGTQFYYNEYFTQRSTNTGAHKGTGKGSQQPTVNQGSLQLAETSKFQLLDYEAELMVSYTINNLRIFSSGVLTFPVNPSTLITDQGTIEEDLDNGFFWTAGLRIRIR